MSSIDARVQFGSVFKIQSITFTLHYTSTSHHTTKLL